MVFMSIFERFDAWFLFFDLGRIPAHRMTVKYCGFVVFWPGTFDFKPDTLD